MSSMNSDGIFISIASAEDKELNLTIQSAIQNAANPDRLFFGVFAHNFALEPQKICDLAKNVVVAQCFYPEKLGVGIPRTVASYLQDQTQKYHLQVDAHMIFQPNWDHDLISAYNTLLNFSDKPIISTYTPWWYRDEQYEIRKYNGALMNLDGEPELNHARLIIGDFNTALSSGMPPIASEYVAWSDEARHAEQFVIAGGFIFSSTDFFYDVAVDPRLTWNGDELVLGLRAWTRGYKIFTIDKPIVWHKNKWTPDSSGNKVLEKGDWRSLTNLENPLMRSVYYQGNIKTKARIKDILLGDYVGYWGAPTVEKLKEYEDSLHVKFSDYYHLHEEYVRTTQDRALLKAMYER